jgi:hypothetical protein
MIDNNSIKKGTFQSLAELTLTKVEVVIEDMVKSARCSAYNSQDQWAISPVNVIQKQGVVHTLLGLFKQPLVKGCANFTVLVRGGKVHIRKVTENAAVELPTDSGNHTEIVAHYYNEAVALSRKTGEGLQMLRSKPLALLLEEPEGVDAAALEILGINYLVDPELVAQMEGGQEVDWATIGKSNRQDANSPGVFVACRSAQQEARKLAMEKKSKGPDPDDDVPYIKDLM